MSTNADDEAPRHYALRQQPRVRREIETHLVRMIELTSEESGAADAPTVMLLHIRHGAQKPLTRREARQVEQGDQ